MFNNKSGIFFCDKKAPEERASANTLPPAKPTSFDFILSTNSSEVSYLSLPEIFFVFIVLSIISEISSEILFFPPTIVAVSISNTFISFFTLSFLDASIIDAFSLDATGPTESASQGLSPLTKYAFFLFNFLAISMEVSNLSPPDILSTSILASSALTLYCPIPPLTIAPAITILAAFLKLLTKNPPSIIVNPYIYYFTKYL